MKEAIENYVEGCVGKVDCPAYKLFMKAILAGMMIAFGAAGSSVAAHDIANVGIARLVAGVVFPMGLMMVVMTGAVTGGSLDDGLAGGQRVLLCRKGQHPFGQRIAGRAGGAVKVQVGVQPPLQPAGRKVAPQLHDGAGQQGLVKVRINGHEIPPSVGYIIIILTQRGRGVKPHFGKNGENLRKNLAE